MATNVNYTFAITPNGEPVVLPDTEMFGGIRKVGFDEWKRIASSYGWKPYGSSIADPTITNIDQARAKYGSGSGSWVKQGETPYDMMVNGTGPIAQAIKAAETGGTVSAGGIGDNGNFWTAESLAQEQQYKDAVARGELKMKMQNGVAVYYKDPPSGQLAYNIPNASGNVASAGSPDAGTYQTRSLPIGPQTITPPTGNLSPGMTGEAVRQLQQYLVSKGYMTQAEMDSGPGVYGPKTSAAVMKLQAALGVDNSSGPGYYGPKTIAAISGGNSTTPQSSVSDVEKYVNSVVDAVVASGKTINPNLTAEDLAAIDPATFLQQAENSIAPEYAGKFAEVKDSLIRTLSNLGYDLNLKKQSIQREAAAAMDTGEEELAGRGLTFSGKRLKFTQDLNDETARSLAAEDVATGRNVQEAISSAEGKIGTEQVRNLGFANPTSQSIQYNSSPLIGSLTSERQFLKESMAKELARGEAERRAYTTRNLSFS